MADPLEGITPEGTIRTGVSSARVPDAFRPVLDAAVAAVGAGATLYVYGSVATGQARLGRSDVDLLSFGLPAGDATDLAAELSDRFLDICRSVDIAAGLGEGLVGEHDEAYGGRVFLRHYCARLCGPELDRSTHDFPADARAARGFNGDIAQHARRWRSDLDAGAEPAEVGRRMSRKTLLAVAGLVSVHDQDWTTDRARAAARWSVVEPILGVGLTRLLSWAEPGATSSADVSRSAVGHELDGTVGGIVEQFAERIGLWDG
ncbi:MAG: hypothetical protein HKN44_01990 [Ilumatobacter sp.]|nr:hypothetical protein [Ilumatobacter sp.]